MQAGMTDTLAQTPPDQLTEDDATAELARLARAETALQ